MVIGANVSKLAERIKKAIADGELTEQEFEDIIKIADEDNVIDAAERELLGQLQCLLANGTIRKVPG